jgi:HD-GYP domain-containing protein (c-di-GMP phosphodiesterase class II)
MALYLNRSTGRDDSGVFELYRRQLSRKKPASARQLLRFLPKTLSSDQATSYFTRYSSRIFTAQDTLLQEIQERVDQEFSCTSVMAFSLKASNRQVGILLLASLDPRVVFSDKQRRSFYMLVSKAAAAIENTYLYDNLQRHYLETVESFAQALEAKDSYTHGHSRQVSLYAGLLARRLGFSAPQRALLEQAALLHDIGKIGIADTILNYPGALSPDDLTEVRKHPCKGRNILAPIRSLSGLAEIVYYHHEHWDGSGYPDGLAGEEIPLMARIIGIADAFDAITSQRPYRVCLDLNAALAELKQGAGSQFDPALVELFISQRDEIAGLLKSRFHSLDDDSPDIKAASVG